MRYTLDLKSLWDVAPANFAENFLYGIRALIFKPCISLKMHFFQFLKYAMLALTSGYFHGFLHLPRHSSPSLYLARLQFFFLFPVRCYLLQKVIYSLPDTLQRCQVFLSSLHFALRPSQLVVIAHITVCLSYEMVNAVRAGWCLLLVVADYPHQIAGPGMQISSFCWMNK